MKAGNCYYSRRGNIHNIIHVLGIEDERMYVEIITVDWNHVNKSTRAFFGNMIYQMYPNPKLIPNSVLKYFEAYQKKIDSAFREFANKIIKLDD
jgi:hypothetical protein